MTEVMEISEATAERAILLRYVGAEASRFSVQ